MSNVIMGRSHTGTIHLLNKTPIEWFFKSQASIETAIYRSEYVAARICVDNIVYLQHTISYIGVSIKGPTWMFGDNFSFVNSYTMPSINIQKRAHLLNYHRVR